MKPARSVTFPLAVSALAALALAASILPADLEANRTTPKETAEDDPPPSPERPLVGAYYYLDFPERWAEGHLGAHLVPPLRPALGEYTLSRRTVEEHVRMLTRGGIDLLVLSWPRSRRDVDRRIRDEFLRASNLAKIRFCFLYESRELDFDPGWGALGLDDWKSELISADCLYLARTYFDHPAYFRIDGKPVLFLYVSRTFVGPVRETIERLRRRLGAAGWDVFLVGDEVFWKGKAGTNLEEDSRDPVPWRIALFDAITSYNLFEGQEPRHSGYPAASRFLADARALYERYRRAAPERVILFPQVFPGYNDLVLRRFEGNYAIPRRVAPQANESSTFDRYLMEVALPMVDPRVPLVLVTSWNEWNEGTQIEPTEAAPPTERDDSPSGRQFTQGYAYGGYQTAYISALRERLGGEDGRADTVHRGPSPPVACGNPDPL